jgi:hypothetical protein
LQVDTLCQLSLDERRHFLRRAALAPLLLCLVAGLHLVRVWTAHQTPWKGGGFGMFSTIDSEANRFLRVYLITDAGELPLPLPAGLDKAAAEQRAAPSATGLQAIARRLAAQDWRWSSDRQRAQAAAIAALGGAAVSGAALRGAIEPTTEPRALTPGQSHVLEPVPLGEPCPARIDFRAVRVECWRLRFAAGDELLSAEPLLSAAVTRQEARP